MLDKQTIEQVEGFVRASPRTIAEIAQLLGRNWRTADAYVERIVAERGSIGVRTFRGGTRGALKVVFWQAQDRLHASAFQERVLSAILAGRTKEDFNPFDIYQYVEPSLRRAFAERQTAYQVTRKQNLVEALRSAQEQVLIFSGDLSWSVASQEEVSLLGVIEELVVRKVPVRVVCDVDLESVEHIRSMLSLNEKYKWEGVEVRHAQQPLRAFVVDGRFARFKQRKRKDTYIFYEVFDSSWVSFVQGVFWRLFRSGVGAKQRIADLESIERIR